MAARLRSSSLLVLLLVLLCLLSPAAAADGSGAGRGRGAEYYQRRYTGRPRRGPLPAVTPIPSPSDAMDAAAQEQHGQEMTQPTAAATNSHSTKTASYMMVAKTRPEGRPDAQGSVNRTGIGGRIGSANSTTARFSSSAFVNNSVDVVHAPASSQWPQHKFVGLPVFTLLRFSNDACGSETAGGWGTCLLPSECSQQGGTPARGCAHDFGVCCVLTETCGGKTQTNNTYFVNPEYPAAGRAVRSCVFTVHKAAPDVTQIRLDLAEFRMAGPTRGTCKRDVFTVSGQDLNSLVPPLCGRNDRQHLYLEVGDRTGPVRLRVVTSSAAEHRWRIRVSQLRETGADRAPPLCLQYHTGRIGRISSFNYQPVPQTGQTEDIGYTNNLNYMICIRKESGFCSITYSTDNFRLQAMANDFNIVNFEDDGSNGGDGTPTVPPDQAGVGPIECRHDYLVLSVDRLCGDRLNDAAASSTLTDNADVTDRSAGQFAVRFVSDQRWTGNGFRLNFRQNPCTSQQAT